MLGTIPLLRLINAVFWSGVVLLNSAALAQPPKPEREEIVYTIVERSPEFPGGLRAMQAYLTSHTHYPDSAAKAKVKGNVFVSFIVECDGQLTHIEVLNGPGYGCEKEAVRVVNAMPRWLPGTQSGYTIRVKCNLPIAFGSK